MKDSTRRKLKLYNLSKRDELYLRERGFINGMGGDGGFRFTEFFRHNLMFFPKYNPVKAKELFKDLDIISDTHDVDFGRGGNYYHFIKSNWDLGANAFKLFHWTSLYKRITIFALFFFGTTIGGRKYFKFGTRLSLCDLLNK